VRTGTQAKLKNKEETARLLPFEPELPYNIPQNNNPKSQSKLVTAIKDSQKWMSRKLKLTCWS
jgi:hypothetical protein